MKSIIHSNTWARFQNDRQPSSLFFPYPAIGINFVMLSIFRDGPEYIQRTQTPFKPTKVSHDFWAPISLQGLKYFLGDSIWGPFRRPQKPSWKIYSQSTRIRASWRSLRSYCLQTWMDDWSFLSLFGREFWTSFQRWNCLQVVCMGPLLALPGCYPCRMVVHGSWSRTRHSFFL